MNFNYFKNKNLTSGFTLLELIIAICLIALLTAIALPKLNNFRTGQIHKNEVGNMLAMLNEARTRALTGDSSRAYSVSIDTTAKTMTLFRVTTDPDDTAYSEIMTLDDKLTLSTSLAGTTDSTITFNRFTGNTVNAGTITVTTTNGAFSRTATIRVYVSGLAALE